MSDVKYKTTSIPALIITGKKSQNHLQWHALIALHAGILSALLILLKQICKIILHTFNNQYVYIYLFLSKLKNILFFRVTFSLFSDK
jgi:hypothetical protein